MVEVKLCPFDNLPCDHVDSCDAVLSLEFGFDCVESGFYCSRAVKKMFRK